MRFLTSREAMRPVFTYPEAKVVWALRALIALIAAYALMLPERVTYSSPGMVIAMSAAGLLVSVGVAFVDTRRPRTLSIAEAIALGAVILHVGGHAFSLYAWIPHYDTLLHLTGSFAAVALIFALSQAVDWVWDWRSVHPFAVGIHAFSLAITAGVVWETSEFAMDTFLGTNEQKNNADTMIDLVADTLGALVGAIGVAAVTSYGRRRGMGEISEEPEPRKVRAGANPHAGKD